MALFSRCLGRALVDRRLRTNHFAQVATLRFKKIIGNREWVGWGIDGCASYFDCVDYPFPAIRWQENTNELIALREKEKGDWRKLTCEEKKCLYRASFCQTFAEILAPTGLWKSILGWVLVLVACGIWLMLGVKYFIYPPLPGSFAEECRRQQLRRMIDVRINPVTGISSAWDFEKDDWKK